MIGCQSFYRRLSQLHLPNLEDRLSSQNYCNLEWPMWWPLEPTWKIGWPNICQSSIKVHHVSPRVCLTDLCLSNTQMMCLLKSATTLPWSKPPYFGYRSQCQMCYQILWDFKFTLGLHVLISYVGALYSLCLRREFKVLSYQNKVQCMI